MWTYLHYQPYQSDDAQKAFPMRKIRIPLDAIESEPIHEITPIGVEMKMQMLRDRPFRWFWKWWCRIFGHKIKTYVGGYSYVGYKNGIPWGRRKGREKRHLRERKFKYLTEGYCTRCGEHFSNTYIKKYRR